MRLNRIAVARGRRRGLPLVYLNQVGGQDELVFDGASFVLNADGTLAVQLPAGKRRWSSPTGARRREGLALRAGRAWPPADERSHAIYQAMMLGLRDYVNKNRFPGVVLGLSGGIDSALSAAVAVDALGADRVRCVMMPSRYTAQDSLEDAAEVRAAARHAATTPFRSKARSKAFGDMLAPAFAGKHADTTEENIQSRSAA